MTWHLYDRLLARSESFNKLITWDIYLTESVQQTYYIGYIADGVSPLIN